MTVHHPSLRLRRAFPLFAIVLLSILHPGAAHSTLSHPPPYTRKLCKGCHVCRPPDTRRWGKKWTGPALEPRVRWKRGQLTTVKWMKNNHEGGFVRLSLLPLSRMYSATAHDRLAFYYGCWEQNAHKCRTYTKRECGADRKRLIFKRRLRVPSVYPDGLYVLAYMWFGGLSESRRTGRYADYTSCAYVEIRGGGPVTHEFTPVFDAGNTGVHRTDPPGLCASSVNNPWACDKGCEGKKPGIFRPWVFDNGRRPSNIKSEFYRLEQALEREGSAGGRHRLQRPALPEKPLRRVIT